MELITNTSDGELNISTEIHNLKKIYDELVKIVEDDKSNWNPIVVDDLKFSSAVNFAMPLVSTPREEYINSLKVNFTQTDGTIAQKLDDSAIKDIFDVLSNSSTFVKQSKTWKSGLSIQQATIQKMFVSYKKNHLKTQQECLKYINDVYKGFDQDVHINKTSIKQALDSKKIPLDLKSSQLDKNGKLLNEKPIEDIYLFAAFVLNFNIHIDEINNYKSGNKDNGEQSVLNLFQKLLQIYTSKNLELNKFSLIKSIIENFTAQKDNASLQDIRKKTLFTYSENIIKMLNKYHGTYGDNTIMNLKVFLENFHKMEKVLEEIEKNQDVYIQKQNNQ